MIRLVARCSPLALAVLLLVALPAVAQECDTPPPPPPTTTPKPTS